MTPSELNAILARLSLSQAAAARLSGFHQSNVSRACRGKIAVPGKLAAFLRLMETTGISAEQAREILSA